MAKKKDTLTVEKSVADFQRAYKAKSKLIEREREDFLYAMGEQWSAEDKAALEKASIKPITDNRIAPNIYLLTGLERQNRTDFKAYPEGEEDSIKAEIASALFKDAIKKSGFAYKSSEQFKDGITCGESHLELYLDNTDSLINGKPVWCKIDGDSLFPDPASREYDFSDAGFVYKLKLDVSRGDLINLYPEMQKRIEKSEGGKLNLLPTGDGTTRQARGYTDAKDDGEKDEARDEVSFDLIERYYKKWVEKAFLGDRKTGEIKESESEEVANAFISTYQGAIQSDQEAYQQAVMAAQMPQAQQFDEMGQPIQAQPAELPPAPPEQDPERFIVIKRQVPEIWLFAHVPGIEEPLADERAWFYPKWKQYPFIPYFARYSTAPLTGNDRHLLVQGLVHGVKGVQEKHNKAEMLMSRHLNTATNSGWLAEEDSWVDPAKVQQFGSSAGVNLEYKKGRQKPERIFPMPLSQGHALISAESAEAIKAQLGINADLLASQESDSSGRAIALRQKQGLLMVQEPFDNLTRTRKIAGQFLLSQLGEIYDTETAIKILGEAFMRKNFPPVMLASEDPMGQPQPMPGPDGAPMEYDRDMAEVAIAEVLSGDLEKYDVSVGEAVASETQIMANAAEIREIATAFPGIIGPDQLVRHSQLPEATKNEILSSIKQAQAAAMGPQMPPQGPAA